MEDWQSVLTEEEKKAALAVQTHPKFLPDEEIQKQVAALSQHKKIQAAQASMAALTSGMTPDEKAKYKRKRDRKTGRQRQKALRKNLAPIFKASLAGTGGSAQKRLLELCPSVVGKGQKTGSKTAKKKKAAKKAARKKKKAASAAKTQHKFMKQQAARAKQAKWQRMNPEAASLLGNPDGPLKGKRVRLIDPGLTEFLRNSPAQVLSHFTVTDTVTIRNHGGSVSTYPSSSVYLLTGREKAP